jgi:hypothetical protein
VRWTALWISQGLPALLPCHLCSLVAWKGILEKALSSHILRGTSSVFLLPAPTPCVPLELNPLRSAYCSAGSAPGSQALQGYQTVYTVPQLELSVFSCPCGKHVDWTAIPEAGSYRPYAPPCRGYFSPALDPLSLNDCGCASVHFYSSCCLCVYLSPVLLLHSLEAQ